MRRYGFMVETVQGSRIWCKGDYFTWIWPFRHTRTIEFWNKFTDSVEMVNADEVYGIFAAPTCTMFSLARTTGKKKRDFESGMQLVEKCLEIIWFCRASNNSTLKFWALENPQGYLRQFFRQTTIYIFPGRIWWKLHKENWYLGVFQYSKEITL